MALNFQRQLVLHLQVVVSVQLVAIDDQNGEVPVQFHLPVDREFFGEVLTNHERVFGFGEDGFGGLRLEEVLGVCLGGLFG